MTDIKGGVQSLRSGSEKSTGINDPSKNVLDLVLAAVQRLDDLGQSVIKRQDDLRDALDRRMTELNELKIKQEDRIFTIRTNYEGRIDLMQSTSSQQMEALRTDFGKQIATILSSQADKSAQLLATQVSAVTERLAVIEKNQYVTGGQTAIRDPYITDQMKLLGDAIQATNRNIESLIHVRDKTLGEKAGQTQVSGTMMAAFMALIGFGSVIVPLILHFVPVITVK